MSFSSSGMPSFETMYTCFGPAPGLSRPCCLSTCSVPASAKLDSMYTPRTSLFAARTVASCAAAVAPSHFDGSANTLMPG